MLIRTKYFVMVGVMMRLPPIIVIDEILKINMGLPSSSYQTTNSVDAAETTATSPLYNNSTAASSTMLQCTTVSAAYELLSNVANISVAPVKFLICTLGILCAASIFMLMRKHLILVYMLMISLSLTFLSLWSNISALAILGKSPCILKEIMSMNMTRLMDTNDVAGALLPHIVAQYFMGMLFAYMHLSPRFKLLKKSMPLIFASPIVLASLLLKPIMIKPLFIIAFAVPLIIIAIILLSIALQARNWMYNCYHNAIIFVHNYSLKHFIAHHWQRLKTSIVLRVFWTIRISQGFISIALNDSGNTLNLLPAMQKLLVDGCETLIALLGMISFLSVIFDYITKIFQWYLLIDKNQKMKLYSVSAFVFFKLALETDLTSMSPDKRFVILCRNLCLLVIAFLDHLHDTVIPILLSLRPKQHIRALNVCAFLVITPLCLLKSLWSRHSLSTWLLAVTAYNVHLVLRVLVFLAMYTLLLLDKRRQTFWEKFDDYKYYIRALDNIIEVSFAAFILLNNAWILVFESTGAIQIISICIGSYITIWRDARLHWKCFMKRRHVMHTISALPEATPAQLQANDDNCAICCQKMCSAKITRCRHYFHEASLRNL